MVTSLYTIGSVLAVSAISLSGVALLGLGEGVIRRSMHAFLSFSTGALLGDVFLHMVPEMAEDGGFGLRTSLLMLGGILLSFSLEKFIHWRHCHSDACDVHHHPVGWMNLIGDGVHNFMDGVLIAGSFLISVPLGITTTIAVLLHEIPQEISDFIVLLHSGFSRGTALLANLLFALAAVAGALLVILTSRQLPELSGYLLPITAGTFVYIAGSDLIPELHKEAGTRQSIGQLTGLLAGIALMAALLLLE
jgi:zinc and cadmium transporter